MRIAFASAHPYLPQIAGGTQSNTHEMALELIARGHEVSVLAGLTTEGWIGTRARMLMKLLGHTVIADCSQGYPVYRSWLAWEGAAEMARTVRPDVVIVQSGEILRVADSFRSAGVPVVPYFHNVEVDDHDAGIETFRGSPFLANSLFTAERYRRTYGIESTVINPFFRAQRYQTRTTRERVLFINPHPQKGVDLALDIATACPDIPFDFVESWTLSTKQRASLIARLALIPNVMLYRRTKDMRVHYARARILLVPSRWEETWGRVASEAHYSGIPVFASRVGGLGEAVGPGGILFDLDAKAAEWVAALRKLWDDPVGYRELSQAASAYATRPQLDPDRQIDQLEMVLDAAVMKKRARAGSIKLIREL
jgi:glycosyltransferase involved in cell wall biosynthesis